MSLPNPYAQYRQSSIETATPARIVVMLYDGAIRFLSQALAAMAAGRHAEQSRLIGNAQAIIAHLHDTLEPTNRPGLRRLTVGHLHGSAADAHSGQH